MQYTASMRIVWKYWGILCASLACFALFSIQFMEKRERRWMESDLTRRADLITNRIQTQAHAFLQKKDSAKFHAFLEQVRLEEGLVDLTFCEPSGCGDSGKLYHQGTHRITSHIREGNRELGTLTIVQDASHMHPRYRSLYLYVFGQLGVLGGIYLLLSVIAYRSTVQQSVRRVRKLFLRVVSGQEQIPSSMVRTEFSPLARDLSRVMRELRRAKESVQNAPFTYRWNHDRLRVEVQRLFGDTPLCVVANREPYIHTRVGDEVNVQIPASGLVTAVEPIVRACSGLWIAHGSGNADREHSDANGRLLVPTERPEYALRRVWLTPEEEDGYYYGFSNEGLWPLCHIAHTRPYFSTEDFEAYEKVNEKFAQAFLEENAEGEPIALIQDYHFALLPRMIRSQKKNATLSLFWHIPWPNPEAFGICPWKKELLLGMLGADLIGFHTQFHCNNFLDTVDRFLEARVDRENFTVTIEGHACTVKPFPISVAWPDPHGVSPEEFAIERPRVMAELKLAPNGKLGLGVDRIDYTKGIVERFRSIERFLERNPEWVGRFSFLQIGAPSRTRIQRYQDLGVEVKKVADEINKKFQSSVIQLRQKHHDAQELARFYRSADICFVSALHDGMNLVAKEYVAARSDLDGVLLLSTFAGASRELVDALLLNPYDVDECADALHRALHMSANERKERMRRLRATVSENNVYAWAVSFLTEIHRLRLGKNRMSPEISIRA